MEVALTVCENFVAHVRSPQRLCSKLVLAEAIFVDQKNRS
jgi:hypothetical protein